MGQIIDNAIALRIIYLLVHSFENWDAFKYGLITADGKTTDKRASNQKERDSWTMLHRLVARLKRIVALAPGGKTLLGRLTASYLLVREAYENDLLAIYEGHSVEELQESLDTILVDLTEEQINDVSPLFEEIGSSVGNGMIAGIGLDGSKKQEVPMKPKNKYVDRNKMFRRDSLPQPGFKTWLQTHTS